MGFSAWVQKYANYYKNMGFLWVCHHIITNLIGHRKWVVIETRIYEDTEKVDAKIPVTIRLLSSSKNDIDRLVEFWPDVYTPTISSPQIIRNLITERLSAGEKCMIAEYDGEIIHMNWIGFYNHHIFEPYEMVRGLGEGEAISHSTFCADAYRNNRLMTAVRYHVLDYLSKNKYKILLNYIRPDNVPAIKVTERFGGRIVQIMHLVNILGIRFSISSKKS